MGARAYAQIDEATDEETMLKTKGNATHRLPMNSHKNKNRENEYLCLGLLTSDCVLKVIKGKKERKQQWLREKKRGVGVQGDSKVRKTLLQLSEE